jgi:tetratricopeptide (TPR) repeat protein
VKSLTSLLLGLASIGFLTFVAAPAVSLAESQETPPERTGGLARTDEALGDIRQASDTPAVISQQKALNAYHRGLKYRDKAWELEEQAAAAEGKKAAKKAAQAHRSYEKAIEQFRKAVKQVPKFAQALGSLGYALLKTGQYEEALAAYDLALAIGPRYPEAIEERGEACLGLDRIEEAKSAYIELVPIRHDLAAKLMTAMKRWVDQRRGDAGGLSEEAIESFAVWIEERSEPVAQVGALASASRS